MKPAAKPTPGVDRHVADGQWIEIFRAGPQTDSNGRRMEFTEDHLQELVASYDPAVHEAPVVVGHPKHNLPAYGWVGALKYVAGSALADGLVEAGKLLYQERESEPAFNEMREAGRFKKRSASFYLPDSPGNPTPGKLHLRHVGWLGAMPPAVKGLKDAEFADDGEGVVEFADDWNIRWGFRTLAGIVGRIRDRIIETDGLEVADRVIPHYEIESLREAGLIDIKSDNALPGFGEGDEPDASDDREPNDPAANGNPGAAAAAPGATAAGTDPTEDQAMTVKQEELDAREAALKQQEEKLAGDQVAFGEQQKALDAEKAQAARTDAADYADGLVRAGKLAPSKKSAVIELLLASDSAGALNFSEEEGGAATDAPAGQVLRDVLDGMPKQFDFSEKSAETDAARVDANDPNAIARAAVSYQEDQKKAGHVISIAQAVNHITTKGTK